MAIKVWGMAISVATRRVLSALEEKGVEYELIKTDLFKGEHKAPAFLALQPFGQLPVFEDGDIRIFESRAIVRYIATKWADQGTDLLGKDAKTKALTETWLEVETNNYNPPVASLVNEKMFKSMFGAGPTDEGVVTAQLAKLNKVLDIYEAVLSKQQYLTGDTFTLADLSHQCLTEYLLAAGVTEPFEQHPAVKAWWERISSRPVWQKLKAQQ